MNSPVKLKVPDELYSNSTNAIIALGEGGGKFYASIQTPDRQYFIDITEEDYDRIKRYWDEGEAVLIDYNGGNIQSGNQIVGTTYRISIDTDIKKSLLTRD